ncbi:MULTISPECIES: Bro-N domain-containing protein [unclassified Gilliamella]|uniref:BRO-N domain-containing protein n=1 Tax=unclassified Gilliamella TaxID=2685620 RepID=UPI00226A35BF|nr:MULTISPECIES: BRO family protein [unclassified Gilliamella]MCX8602648.1 ORF6C domain-containing protein [Gilliamella sp. B3722]MCX8607724.1 ORF6C domain-containing protein [Gilliamella sp. B3771]MCX8611873.1 ORF6C domain-containing protein [Gilliamella sp. B3891]MCX8614325.1 ORF6C domain-containing protein [Gilliamella sp. B3773]MCX8614885.1 ORF6C domain-containing protein [Gilliamella sp. B3770]
MSNSLVFHNTTIQSVNHNNQIWITSSELAKLLQYKSTDSVTKIYNRNFDEFTRKMTETVKLTAPNNLIQTVRIFSLRGAHLIAMLAKTEIAKEVRKWLLDLADKEIGISETISLEQQQAIQQAVNERSYRTVERHQAIYTKLHQQFKIPRYQDLPASQFENAIKWLGGIHSRSVLSDEDWYDLAWLYKAAERMRYQLELI